MERKLEEHFTIVVVCQPGPRYHPPRHAVDGRECKLGGVHGLVQPGSGSIIHQPNVVGSFVHAKHEHLDVTLRQYFLELRLHLLPNFVLFVRRLLVSIGWGFRVKRWCDTYSCDIYVVWWPPPKEESGTRVPVPP
jgi:hypothetical protein